MQLSIVILNGRKYPHDLKMSAQYLALSCSRARVLHPERLTWLPGCGGRSCGHLQLRLLPLLVSSWWVGVRTGNAG